MALDLSSLDDSESAANVATGKPLELPLVDIEEDLSQVRTEFNPGEMASLADSIRERGVKTPISVRPHPSAANKWIINNGARRYRASLMAKKDTIPAFVDEVFTDYDQVIVNDQHATLTPMELAHFIAKKQKDGDKKGVIAKSLSIDQASVTHHLALLDLPDSVDAVYRSGRCTSVKTLYELRNLRASFPEEVDRWCATAETVTRTLVTVLGKQLNAPTATGQQVTPAVAATPSPSGTKGGSDIATGGAAAAAPAKANAMGVGAARASDQVIQVAQMVRQLAAFETALSGHPQALAQLSAATSALVALKELFADLK